MSKILILLAFFGLASSGTFMALDRANAFPGGGGNGTTCSGLQCKKDDGCDLLRGTYTFWHQSKYCENGPAPGKCVESPTKKACYDDTYYKLGQCNSGKVIGNDSYMVTYCTGTVTDQPEKPVERPVDFEESEATGFDGDFPYTLHN